MIFKLLNRLKEGKEQMNISKKPRSEETEQIEFMHWAKLQEEQYPELRWMFHVPNGGKRNRWEAVALKQMGVKSGVSDLMMLVPRGKYSGLIIEMKYGTNTLTEEQKAFLHFQMNNGYCCVVCYSSALAKDLVRTYLALGWDEEIGSASFKEGTYKLHKLWKIPVMKEYE